MIHAGYRVKLNKNTKIFLYKIADFHMNVHLEALCKMNEKIAPPSVRHVGISQLITVSRLLPLWHITRIYLGQIASECQNV